MARPGISKAMTFDKLLELHDGSAAVTADDIGQTAAEDPKIVDLYQGASIGDKGIGAEFEGRMLVDVTAIDQTTGDELYSLVLEGSDTSDFSGNIAQLCVLQLGDEDTMLGNANVDFAGASQRHLVPFTNEKNGVVYRYVRLAFDVNGTSPSITCTAFLGKR